MTARRALALAVVLLLGPVTSLTAQERPVVFLHGLASSPDTWAPAAERIRQQLLIRPVLPALDWAAAYGPQAQSLQTNPLTRSLPSNTVVVGHSNGGLVARQWSRSRPVSGIVTVGSPHYGAPIVSRMGMWLAHTGATAAHVGHVFGAFERPSSVSWVITVLAADIITSRHFTDVAVSGLLGIVPKHLGIPVFADMLPGSATLQQLNSASNLTREAQQIAGRVGVANIMSNYAYGGPFRAVTPENADAITRAFYGIIAALEYRASWIFAHAPHGDVAAIQQGQALLSLAGHLRLLDPVYCAAVSVTSGTTCIPNDGVLPHTAQKYPGAINTLLSPGPTHVRQTAQTEGALISALVGTMRVARRTASPPPPPPSPPPPPPPGDPDPPPVDPSRHDILLSGERLRPGEHVRSGNGRYMLVYQGDGNLVLYRGGTALWHTRTHGTSPGTVEMQSDGNFVVYDSARRARWASGTHGNPGAHLLLQNDGNVVIYSSAGAALWDTETSE